MPPVLANVVEALEQHARDLVAGHYIVRQVRDVGHLGAGGAPGVVGGGLSDLGSAGKEQRDVPQLLPITHSSPW